MAKDIRRVIIDTWLTGGEFAHNLVSIKLRQLAMTDKAKAKAIYKELQTEHNY